MEKTNRTLDVHSVEDFAKKKEDIEFSRAIYLAFEMFSRLDRGIYIPPNNALPENYESKAEPLEFPKGPVKYDREYEKTFLSKT